MKMSIRWVRRGSRHVHHGLLAAATVSAVAVCPLAGGALVTEPGAFGAAGDAVVETVAPRPAVFEVAGDRLNVRARPGLRHEITCQVLRGDRVTAVREENGWHEILPPAGSTVWIHGAFVRDGSVIGDRVNVRAGPSLSYSVVGRVTRGTRIEARSEYNEWVEILPPEGVTFWVSGEFLQPVTSADTTVIRTFTPPDEPGVEKVELPGPIAGRAGGREAREAEAPGEIFEPDFRQAARGPVQGAVAPDEAAYEAAGQVEVEVAGEVVEPGARAEGRDSGQDVGTPEEAGAEAESAAIPPAQPESEPLVLPESEIQWLGPPKDIVQIGEIHRTGFLVRRPGSHKLIQRTGRRARLVGYLRSDEVDLDRFLGKNCRVVGAEQWAKGWPRPVIHVRQVSIVR